MRICDLLAMEELRLTLLTGDAGREFGTVHITDLPEPGRYLSGGELVLTGLMWWHTAADSRPFVTALADAGVAALGAGQARLGHVPADLVDACREAGLPLLDVPTETSFRTLAELVAPRLSGDARDALGRHRRLVAAVAEGAGLPELFALTAAELGVTGAVVSATGQVVAGAPDDPVRLARAFLTAPRLPCLAGGHTLFAAGRGPRAAAWALACDGDLLDRADLGYELAAFVALERARMEEGRRVERRLAAQLVTAALTGADPADLTARLRTCALDPAEPYTIISTTTHPSPHPDPPTDGALPRTGTTPRPTTAPRPTTTPTDAAPSTGGGALPAGGAPSRDGAGARGGTAPGRVGAPAEGAPAAGGALSGEGVGTRGGAAPVGVGGSAGAELPVGGAPAAGGVPSGGVGASVGGAGSAARAPYGEGGFGVEVAVLEGLLGWEVVAVAGEEGAVAVVPLRGRSAGEVAARVRAGAEVLGALPGVRVCAGVSGELTGAAALRGGVEEAGHARRLAAARGGGVVTSDEIYTHALLLATVPGEVRSSFAARLLGPVLEYDARHQSELVATLRAFLDCAGSWNACAARMHVHVNTVRYRVKRVEDLTGRDLSTMADRVDFFLALRAG
ncbi:PucR family transcriptional regulator [Nonomuraea sp. ATR24]|uniref:PucR family transcriptional regulator n=1 Tax=Nonomuraea sp. ATR24 TaxID=1676744 RepID=UPI0035C0871C